MACPLPSAIGKAQALCFTNSTRLVLLVKHKPSLSIKACALPIVYQCSIVLPVFCQ